MPQRETELCLPEHQPKFDLAYDRSFKDQPLEWICRFDQSQ